MHYTLVASINEKSPCSLSRSIAINIEPLAGRHRFALTIWSRQFLPIKDNEKTTTSKPPLSTCLETDYRLHAITFIYCNMIEANNSIRPPMFHKFRFTTTKVTNFPF